MSTKYPYFCTHLSVNPKGWRMFTVFDSKVYGSFFFKQPVAGTYGKPTHSRNSWNKEIHPDGEKKKLHMWQEYFTAFSSCSFSWLSLNCKNKFFCEMENYGCKSTFYTLTSVFKFSTLISIHFLTYLQGEFVLQSIASSVCDLDVWFRGDIVRRK